ncbi:hypothetical protein QN363_20190, partial [Undibacterium sp. CCC2.1]
EEQTTRLPNTNGIDSNAIANISRLGLPAREGSWLLSLGVEIDGQILDLVPLLANLLQRDRRWLNIKQVMAIDDLEVVQLRAPGGKRIDA